MRPVVEPPAAARRYPSSARNGHSRGSHPSGGVAWPRCRTAEPPAAAHRSVGGARRSNNNGSHTKGAFAQLTAQAAHSSAPASHVRCQAAVPPAAARCSPSSAHAQRQQRQPRLTRRLRMADGALTGIAQQRRRRSLRRQTAELLAAACRPPGSVHSGDSDGIGPEAPSHGPRRTSGTQQCTDQWHQAPAAARRSPSSARNGNSRGSRPSGGVAWPMAHRCRTAEPPAAARRSPGSAHSCSGARPRSR